MQNAPLTIEQRARSRDCHCRWHRCRMVDQLYPKVVNTESILDFDNVPFRRECLAQSRRAPKCPLIPSKLHTKLIQTRKENVKTLWRRRSSYYRTGYGFPSPSSLNRKFWKLTTKPPRTANNHSLKRRSERASPLCALAKNWNQKVPDGSLRTEELPLTRWIFENPKARNKD